LVPDEYRDVTPSEVKAGVTLQAGHRVVIIVHGDARSGAEVSGRAGASASAAGTHWAEVRVVDPERKPVANLTVTLLKPGGVRETATTDDDGVARWENLPEGETRILFDDDGAVFEAL
jgi:hypothetical protein